MADDDLDIRGFGPKMLVLTEKQQRYVLAMLSDPLGNPTVWARAAGYSDHLNRARISGHYCAHLEKIEEAAREEARRHLSTIGPVLAIGVMLQIARKKGHKDQLRAAEMLANRAGFHEATEHVVTVDDRRPSTDAARVARITELAGELGVDVTRLLGVNVSREPPKLIAGAKLIEHEATE